MANTIQEQGPATYTLMRERVEAVRAREGATNEPASDDGPPDTATILRGLTGKPAEATLLAGTAPLPRFAPTADVENDGDRGPRALTEDEEREAYQFGRNTGIGTTEARRAIASGKVPRALTDADRDDADRTMLRARCDDLATSLPPHHVRVLSRMLGELPPGNLLQHLEAITADAVEGAGAPNNYRASGWEEQARAALLDAWRAYERIMLRPDEPHTPRHTVHDYTSGAVAEQHRVSER